MRARSLVTILAIIAGLMIYALATMLLAELLPAYWPAQAAFFAVAGIVWVIPAAVFLRWSSRPPLR
jgi:Protein of unknown function (DUF2842)